MKLYVGGLGHGQDVLAEKETGRTPKTVNSEEAFTAGAINNFEELVREQVKNGIDAREYTKALIEKNPDAVVVCNEIGYGIHPLDREERLWREQTGRCLCILAEASESVTRVYCGIGQKLK